MHRSVVFACLLGLGACGNDAPQGPTLEGVDPPEAGTGLAPDQTLEPEGGLAPEPAADRTVEPEATLQPDPAASPD